MSTPVGGGDRLNTCNTREHTSDNPSDRPGVGGMFMHGSGWATTPPGPHLTTQHPLQFNNTASSNATNSCVGSMAPDSRSPASPDAAYFHDASNWCHSPMAAMIAAATTQGQQPHLHPSATMPQGPGDAGTHPGGSQRAQCAQGPYYQQPPGWQPASCQGQVYSPLHGSPPTQPVAGVDTSSTALRDVVMFIDIVCSKYQSTKIPFPHVVMLTLSLTLK